jgi:Fur family zinc uptake transcriptional regulator
MAHQHSDEQHKHAHTEHTGEDLIAAAETALTDAGEQWTGMRASVFEELCVHDRPASAYDIADNLSRTRGKRVAPNSVYRILDLFVRTNLVNRIESANAYLVNTHPGCRHDCIFLICDDCGKARHLDDARVTGALRDAGHDAGFAAVRPVVELRGLCEACAA